VNLGGALVALLSDPTYGIPLVLAVGITAGVSWWAQWRTGSPPSTAATPAPEFWRIQIDSRAYFTLREGRYLVAVDGLGRRLGSVLNEKFHVKLGRDKNLSAPAVDAALPSSLTLRSIIGHLNRAYGTAYWAEHPGWLAERWPWLQRQNRRRAARNFALVVDDLAEAIPALEGR
jgi:hypothetical protein